MAKKIKFPEPTSCKLKHGAVLCDAERVLALYNQATGKKQQRITKPVEKWFTSEVPNHGWAGSNFLPEVQSGHGAGCVLFVPPQQVNVDIKVTNKTLVLKADEE